MKGGRGGGGGVHAKFTTGGLHGLSETEKGDEQPGEQLATLTTWGLQCLPHSVSSLSISQPLLNNQPLSDKKSPLSAVWASVVKIQIIHRSTQVII